MKDDLEILRRELDLALGRLDGQQTQLRPLSRPEKWSIQQIVGHLLRTYVATEEAFVSRLAKGQPTRAKVTLAQRAVQAVLLRGWYFPHGRVAPVLVCPSAGEEAAPAGMLIERIASALSAMDQKMVAAEVIFGHTNRPVTHMILGPLSIEQWAKFHLLHGRHHVKQITAIRNQHGI